MREMEKSQSADWVATKNHRTDIPFVRVAKSGGWKEKLPQECVAEIEAAWGETMLALGYELVSAATDPMIGVLSEKQVAR
jgi:hypothetical protein